MDYENFEKSIKDLEKNSIKRGIRDEIVSILYKTRVLLGDSGVELNEIKLISNIKNARKLLDYVEFLCIKSKNLND